MIKVKAKSLTNPSIFDEQEIVVTYNSDSSIVKLIDYEIFVSGLSSEYNFVSTDEVYIITASLSPTSTRNSYIGYNIKEGEDIITVKDVSFINSETKLYFCFNTPTAKYSDILFSFYKEDQPNVKKDVSTRLSFYPTVLFKNIDGGPYYPGNTYKFDYYTVPVIADRNLDVSIIQNANYIAECYDSSQTGTSGTMNFVPKDVSTTSPVVFKFTDPNTDASNNITFDVEPAEEMPNYRIEVTGNKRDYYFDKDTSIDYKGDIQLEGEYSDPERGHKWHLIHKNVITYREIPNTSTRLTVNVYNGTTSNYAYSNGAIFYSVYDVSGGSGKIGFTVKPTIKDEDVSICIYDPNNTNIRADIAFTVHSQLDSEVELRLPQMLYNEPTGNSYYKLVYTDASIIKEDTVGIDGDRIYDVQYFKSKECITLEYNYPYTKGVPTGGNIPYSEEQSGYSSYRNTYPNWKYINDSFRGNIVLPNLSYTAYMKDTSCLSYYVPRGTIYIQRNANIKSKTGNYETLPINVGVDYYGIHFNGGLVPIIANLNIDYSNVYTYLDWSGPGEGTTHQVSRPIIFAANSTPYDSMYGYSNTECLVLCTSSNKIIKTATKNNEDTSLFTDFFEECYTNAYRIKVVDSINNYPA